MSTAVEVPMRSVHHRRSLVWLIVAFAAAFALAAGVLIVHDSGTESAVESNAASTGPVAATAPAPPTVCWSQYSSLLAATETSMSPEAVDRITPVLSEETRAGLSVTGAVLAATNIAPSIPDPVTLAWAIGRLTPAESAAIMVELPPALQEAVANHAADSAAILATLPPATQAAVANGALDTGLVGNPCP